MENTPWGTTPDKPLIDFAIITAVKTEREAVCRAFKLTERRHRVRVGSKQYWRGGVELENGAFYEIVVAQAWDMAGITATLTTMETVQDWKPGALLLVGFAAAAHDGSEDDHERLGDLIIGSHVYYYERGKATDNGVIQEPYMHSGSPSLLRIASTLPNWTARILAQRPDKTGERPRVMTGVIASGEKVIAAEAIREQIRNGHRKIRAIEMEGYGFSQAAWASLNVDHLILKAICDRADRDKADQWQPYAAAVAAGFAKFFLLNVPLTPRNSPKTDGKPKLRPVANDQSIKGGEVENWEDHLPKINFKTVFSIVHEVFAKIEEGGAALFLLQNSKLNGGQWCIAHIKEILSKDSTKFKPYKIGFLKHQTVSPVEFLNRIGKHLDVKLPYDSQAYPDLILERLRASLQPGSTILIELSLANDLSQQRNFLLWLITELWKPMVRMIKNATDHVSSTRIVFVINAEGTLNQLSLDPSILCTRKYFDEEKMLELHLSKWNEKEIRTWLIKFLPATLTNEEYGQMAESIYNSSGRGLPLAVYSSLMDWIAQNIMPNASLQEELA